MILPMQTNHTKSICRRVRLALATGLCLVAALYLGAAPDVAAQTQSSDWRVANDAVGKFLRGHIDIVRAEAKSGSAGTVTGNPSIKASVSAISLENAKKQALRARAADLFTLGGQSAVDRQVQAVKVTELLYDVENAWLSAVASHQVLALQQNATDAALIGSELATRMGEVGNWGADRVLAAELDAKTEQLKLLQAQQAAKRHLLALEGLLMQTGVDLPDSLPELRGLGARRDLRASVDDLANERLSRLPDYSSRLLALKQWQEQAGDSALGNWHEYVDDQIDAFMESADAARLVIDPSRVLWNHAVKEAVHASTTLTELTSSTRKTIAKAQADVQNAYAQVMLLANEIVPLAFRAEEEAVYQYNGMFISTWGLLEQYRSRVDAQIAAVNAQVLYLQTDAAFKAYLAGAQYRPPAGALDTGLANGDSGGH